MVRFRQRSGGAEISEIATIERGRRTRRVSGTSIETTLRAVVGAGLRVTEVHVSPDLIRVITASQSDQADLSEPRDGADQALLEWAGRKAVAVAA